MRETIKELVYKAILDRNTTGTYWRILKVENGLRWAICAVWLDLEGKDDWIVHAKIAYQPTNSLLQCDYDVDWTMPTINGWVDDTELPIGATIFDATDDKISYLSDEWDRIQRTYIQEVAA